MGAAAAKEAVEEAGIDPQEIDMIIATTVTPDCLTPSLACLVGKELGIESAAGMDLNAACAGLFLRWMSQNITWRAENLKPF